MRTCLTRSILLGLAAAATCGVAMAQQPVDNGLSGRIRAIDPATGKLVAPTPAQVADLQKRANAQAPKTAPRGTQLPRTQADAAKAIIVRKDGTELMPASQDSLSSVVQVRQADGSSRTSHGDAQGHAEPSSHTQEKARD